MSQQHPLAQVGRIGFGHRCLLRDAAPSTHKQDAFQTQAKNSLERRTEPPDAAAGDEGGGELREGFKEVEASLVAGCQAATTAEPSERAFDHPAMASQPLGAVDAAPGNPRLDAAPARRSSTVREVVTLISMRLRRSPLRPADARADRRHGIDQFVEEPAIVDVCCGEPDGERDALGVSNEMAFGAGSTAIGRIGTGFFAPLLAGTDALSTQARLPSMAPARPRRSSRTRGSLSRTPAVCHSRSRRQHVMPDPHPLSWGSLSQGIPLFSTNTMPLSAARCGRGARPPFGFGRSGGGSGSITVHNSSGTRGLAMPPRTAHSHRRSRFC